MEKLNVKCNDWHATHDHMSKTLRFDGNCLVEGGGFALRLQPRQPQGINPQILMLDLIVTPTGESPSQQVLHYEQPWSDGGVQYTEIDVQVRGDWSFDTPSPLTIEDVY